MQEKRHQPAKFSDQLEAWLKGHQPKTLASLDKVFGDKSYAISFLILMIFPALPIPTGGITHVFEIITMLLALEMVAGLKTPWLPKKWKHMHLGKSLTGKVIPEMLKRIRWLENRSSKRGQSVLTAPIMPRLMALFIFAFALGAFLSPPFSGLDTLPALGVVIISLAIILDDFFLLIAGVLLGVAGIALSIALGAAIVESSKHFF